MVKKVFLWNAPRCISTTFERCMMEVKNCKTFHEPFRLSYYIGPDRQSTRYLDRPIAENESYHNTVLRITKDFDDDIDLIFVKQTAYHIENHLDILLDKGLADFQHTFLIRNPAKAVPSLYEASTNIKLTGWDVFNPREVGFQQLKDVYEFVKKHFDNSPIVIDADDLLRDPEATMRAYLKAIGVPFDQNILTWKPGQASEEWTLCKGWHQTTINSCGFQKYDPEKLKILKDLTKYPDEVRQCVDKSQPLYRDLYNHKIS